MHDILTSHINFLFIMAEHNRESADNELAEIMHEAPGFKLDLVQSLREVSAYIKGMQVGTSKDEDDSDENI